MNLNVRYLEEFVTLTEKKNFWRRRNVFLFRSRVCRSILRSLKLKLVWNFLSVQRGRLFLRSLDRCCCRMRERWSVWNMNLKKCAPQDSSGQRQYCARVDSFNETARDYGTDCRILNENPDMTLQTIEGDSTFVKELLTDGKCDIAF